MFNLQNETHFKNDKIYTVLTKFSMHYLIMWKVYTDVGGIK